MQAWAAANREAVLGLRVWGSNVEHHFPPAFDRLWIGSNPAGPDVPEGHVIRIQHPSVSRRHATVERHGPHIVVVDQDSKNGTYCDERAQGVFELTPGAVLHFGQVRVVAFNARTQLVRAVLRRHLGYHEPVQPMIEALQHTALQRQPFVFVGGVGSGALAFARQLHVTLPANAWPFVEPMAAPTDLAGQRALVASAAYGTLAIDSERKGFGSYERLRGLYDAIASNAYHVRLVVAIRPEHRIEHVIGADLRSRVQIVDLPPLRSRLPELPLLLEDTITYHLHAQGIPGNVFAPTDRDELVARITETRRGRPKIETWEQFEENVARLLAVRAAGSLNRAAAHLGLTPGTLSKWASKYGWTKYLDLRTGSRPGERRRGAR